MNKINPLYFVLLLLILLFFVVYKNYKIQDKISNSVQAITIFEQKADYISKLKKHWRDKKVIKRKVNSILKSPQLKGIKIDKEEKRNSIKISANELNAKKTRALFAKFFNAPLIIKSFDVKRYSDTNVSVSLEIGL